MVTQDARGRPITVTAWEHLYFSTDQTRPVTIIRCHREEGGASARDPREIWLLWESPSTPTHPAEDAPLPQVPGYYARRFSVDHGFRFDKQSLLWDEPRFRTPQQFQRWTTLMTIAHDTLVLLQPVVEGLKLPWERKTDCPKTPQQVRRAFAGIYPELGTPAPKPQPRGKSPGRAVGATVKAATRFSLVKKSRDPDHQVPVVSR